MSEIEDLMNELGLSDSEGDVVIRLVGIVGIDKAQALIEAETTLVQSILVQVREKQRGAEYTPKELANQSFAYALEAALMVAKLLEK